MEYYFVDTEASVLEIALIAVINSFNTNEAKGSFFIVLTP